MIDIKENFKTTIKEIWQGGFFNHPEAQPDGLKSLLNTLYNNINYKLSQLKQCPERTKGKDHVWETHQTDSGEETFCSKCFIAQPYITGQKEVLRSLLTEIL